jgi:hypothetical protein
MILIKSYLLQNPSFVPPSMYFKTSMITKQNRGFTLVLTISLMVLLTLIAIGMLSLSSVTLRNSAQGMNWQQARSNARMALMLALGDLQSELGPDRRVNCLANMDATVPPVHGQWLSVYDSWNATEENRPQSAARFRRHLVSGDPTLLRTLASAKTTLANEKIMVGNGTMGTGAASGRVTAGLLPILNNQGQYAWWIADENSKAKINAGLEIPAANNQELLALQAADAAPGTGFRLVNELSGLPVSAGRRWQYGDELSAKSISMASLDLLPGAVPSLRGYFHDVTQSSYGLLADVRNGGLKRDLSLYLERSHSPTLQQALYTVSGSARVNYNPDASSGSGLNDFSGITMEELWLYYNLYKEVQYNRPASSDDRVGRRASGFPTLLTGNSREEVVSDRFYPYKRHVYSQVKYMLSLAAVPTAADPNRFDLRVAIDPIVVLWNPNNVAVEYQPGGFTTVGFSGLPYIADFQTPTGTVSVPFTSFFPHTGVNVIPGIVGLNHAIVLQPGESRVFSRVQGQGDNLASGWRYTEGTLINHASFPKNLQRADTVRLTLRPNTSAFIHYLTFWFGPRTPANAATPALQSGTYILRGDTAAASLPTVATGQTITVGNIVDEVKIPHLLFSQTMRSERETNTPSKSWIWSNPGVGFRASSDDSQTAKLAHQMEIAVFPVSTWENPYVQITPGNQAYWGGGVRADFGVPFFTYRSVPLTPMKSIAAFQHSCANGMRRYWKDSSVSIPGSSFPSNAMGLDGHRYLMPMGTKLIGNSFAHPLIPRNNTFTTLSVASTQADPPVSSSTPMADHAYLANAALWDTWYFSSLAPQTVQPYRSSPRTMQQVFNDFFPVSASQKPIPLPNARMTPYRGIRETSLRTLLVNNNPATDAYRRLASFLMVDGAFNVNSTSVNAWRVMLGSLRDHATARLPNNSSGLTLRQASTNETPVNGLIAANGGLSTPSGDTKAVDQWTGFRTLSDSEIEALATALVAEVRKRGPFLSLSDFVNRRIGTDVELARHGALQAAIETAKLNGNLDQGARALGNVAGAAFPEAGRGSRAAGIPGFITQADLLTPLGPALQARSDTFTIRAYGNATDANGKILAEAWCEAVVQRLPEYIHGADLPHVAETSLTSPLNRKFGRRFQVLSFRWRNTAEI